MYRESINKMLCFCTENDKKRYPCEIEGCTKRFAQKGSIRTHMLTIHGTKPEKRERSLLIGTGDNENMV